MGERHQKSPPPMVFMKGQDFIKAKLAEVAWNEGKEDGPNAILGVAFAIRDRVRNGWQGGDWLRVLQDVPQYSAYLNPPPYTIPDPRNPAFQLMLQEVDGIFSGMRPNDITQYQPPMGVFHSVDVSTEKKPALYWGRLSQITSPWFLEKISLGNPPKAQVGMLSFW